jgi:drug/metabolite transporter (DMT)-like permease
MADRRRRLYGHLIDRKAWYSHLPLGSPTAGADGFDECHLPAHHPKTDARFGIYTTFFYSGLVGLALASALLPFAEPLPNLSLTAWILFALLGLLGGLAHLLVVLAFYQMRPHKLTPLVFLQLIWAIAYGYFIFHELPDGWSFIGMALIAASGAWLIWNHRASTPKKPKIKTR